MISGSGRFFDVFYFFPYKAPLYGRRTAQMKIVPFAFEETCRYFKSFSDEDKALLYGIVGGTPQYLLQINDKMSVEDNNKRQTEIDILAEQDRSTALFGECKWTNERVDLGVLETLVRRSALFPYEQKHFCLFAKSGFTKGCVDKAKEMGNVALVRYEDIVDIEKEPR